MQAANAAGRVIVGGPVAIAATVTALAWQYQPPDWALLHAAGQHLIGGGLDVYVRHPDAQLSGPLALALAAAPRPVFSGLVCCLLGYVMRQATKFAGESRALLLYGSVAAIPWAFFALGGHVDDALVVAGAAAMVGGTHTGRVCVGWGFVLALAAKPTAIILAPLLLPLGSCLAGSCYSGVGPLGGWGCGWLPPRRVWGRACAALVRAILPRRASILDFPRLGVQFLGGIALCWAIARRRDAAAAVLAAVTFRTMLEPGALPSYSSSLVALSLLLPQKRSVATSLAGASWVVSYLYR